MYWQHWLFKEIRGKCLALRSAINRKEGRRQPWWETAKMRCQTLTYITDEINRRQKVGLWQRRGKPKTQNTLNNKHLHRFCLGFGKSKQQRLLIGGTYGDVECLMCATGYWSAVQINCDDSAKESISLNHRDLGMDLVKHVPGVAKKQKPHHPCFLTSWVHVVSKNIICILDFIQYAAFRVPAVQNIPQRKNSHIAAHSNCSAYVQCAGLVVSTTHMTFNRTCCGRIVFTTLVTHTRRTHIRHHCKRAHQEQNVIAWCGNVFITCLYHGSIWIWSDMFVMQFCTCCISCWHGHSSTLWTWGDNVVQGHFSFCKQTVAIPLILVAGAIGAWASIAVFTCILFACRWAPARLTFRTSSTHMQLIQCEIFSWIAWNHLLQIFVRHDSKSLCDRVHSNSKEKPR